MGFGCLFHCLVLLNPYFEFSSSSSSCSNRLPFRRTDGGRQKNTSFVGMVHKACMCVVGKR